jgi:hypothetical protein
VQNACGRRNSQCCTRVDDAVGSVGHALLAGGGGAVPGGGGGFADVTAVAAQINQQMSEDAPDGATVTGEFIEGQRPTDNASEAPLEPPPDADAPPTRQGGH